MDGSLGPGSVKGRGGWATSGVSKEDWIGSGSWQLEVRSRGTVREEQLTAEVEGGTRLSGEGSELGFSDLLIAWCPSAGVCTSVEPIAGPGEPTVSRSEPGFASNACRDPDGLLVCGVCSEAGDLGLERGLDSDEDEDEANRLATVLRPDNNNENEGKGSS